VNLADRLNRLLARGNLSIADLARWLDRPHATVSVWVHGRGSPAGTKKDREQVEREIKRMEGLMGKGLPVPFLPRDERLAYIAKLKG
jgi:hypothetical protein